MYLKTFHRNLSNANRQRLGSYSFRQNVCNSQTSIIFWNSPSMSVCLSVYFVRYRLQISQKPRKFPDADGLVKMRRSAQGTRLHTMLLNICFLSFPPIIYLLTIINIILKIVSHVYGWFHSLILETREKIDHADLILQDIKIQFFSQFFFF